MRRRMLLAGILGSALAQPVRAQPVSRKIVGFLGSRTRADTDYVLGPFVEGMAEFDLVLGRNLEIVYRWADGDYSRLDALAAELVSQKVDILVAAGGPPAAFAAKRATTRIPVVFSGAGDPVHLGLVDSLSRPGGNVTGMATLTVQLVAKWIELLRELLPTASGLGILVNASNPSGSITIEVARSTAAALSVPLSVETASSHEAVDLAFARFVTQGAGGIVVPAEPFFDSNREFIVAAAARHALPAVYGWREYVQAGGLASYGTSLPDSYRQAGRYVGRIARGERPADLPVMQPSKFELALNLVTARTLGIQVPPGIAARADDLVE